MGGLVRVGGRPAVLVLGGSMAGMLAARVLADHADVTLVERDELPVEAEQRRGVPQAHHLHALLVRGLRLVEGWFPGVHDDLVRAGGSQVDHGHELGFLGPFGWSPEIDRGALVSVWATRNFLDAHVRRRLRADARITWIEGRRADALVLDAAKRRVTGVRTDDGATLEADLVIDTTGRGSALPGWLTDAGFTAPPESEVDAGTVYATALVRLARPMPNGWKVLFLMAAPPAVRAGGVLAHVDGERAMLTVIGDAMPTTTDGMIAYVAQLRSTVIADALVGATWLTEVRQSRSTKNTRRHYERVTMPAGLVAMGDSLCAFNPIYGQGMSVAAMEAEELARLAGRSARALTEPGFAAHVHKRFARIVAFPWAAATGDDFRIPTTIGARTPGLRWMHGYMDRVFALATRDRAIATQLTRVLNLVDSPGTLFKPRILWKAMTLGKLPDPRGPFVVPVSLGDRTPAA
jgi:2-polyprenyl-6-methoxyphenol hydroxylase-like FAD-dependent oxidoreductase